MEKHSRFIGLGIAIGTAIGIAMSLVTHQPGVWLTLGLGIGLAIGVAIRDRRQSRCGSLEQKSLKS